MADDLEQLEDWVGGMLAAVGPAARRKLALLVARDLRRANAARIAAQVGPDGSPFAPRKRGQTRGGKGLRSKAGRIKARAAARAAGPMFRKLRLARFLTAEATADEASAGFPANAASRIARIHQEGLRDRVGKGRNAAVVSYPARVLLGFSDEDRRALAERVITHLDPSAG